jgi:hypothetical protein
MADNTQVPGGTGDVVRDKDRAGVKTQVVGLDLTIGGGAETLMNGTMPVSLASVPTVTEKQDQTALVQTTWTSATALNTTTATYACTGYGTANIGVAVPTTATAGAVTVEVSQDGGTTWAPAPAVRQDNGSWEIPIPLAYFPGTNGSRIYAVSVDAFTHVRVKLTTVIVGAGNTVISITAVAGGIEPFVTIRPRKVPTYRAVFRQAARPNWLSNAFGAAGRKQYATIHHAAASTKTVRLRRVRVAMTENTAASYLIADLVRITTAPATGNPAVTPGVLDSADPAAEATCLALPTTAGTEGAIISNQIWDAGIIAGASTTAINATATWQDLLPPGNYDDESKAPTIRAGVLEGWAVTIDAQAITNPKFQIEIEFTEEAP